MQVISKRGINFTKLKGTAEYAPIMNMKVEGFGLEDEPVAVQARIDTGADITCVPVELVRHLLPAEHGKPVLIRGHDGSLKRCSTYKMAKVIEGRRIIPERGILLTESTIALIGMDILRRMEFSMCGGCFMLKHED